MTLNWMGNDGRLLDSYPINEPTSFVGEWLVRSEGCSQNCGAGDLQYVWVSWLHRWISVMWFTTFIDGISSPSMKYQPFINH